MPEIVEVRIMADFINKNSKNVKFNKIYGVEKGNIPHEILRETFTLFTESFGKELRININTYEEIFQIYVFMGMNGNWKYVDTSNWNETKHIRLRLDSNDGKSLILHGGYMGPKYKIRDKFTGSKRGPDPIDDFNSFKSNILDNIDKKDFNHPIYEVLLNQKYFNGIGNYMRSTILYYLDENPFQSANVVINKRPEILELCRDIALKSYDLNGGQLKDWKNPFDTDSTEFQEWVYYKKGNSIKDKNNRTFWFNPKWEVKND